jgi:hypothetical protein
MEGLANECLCYRRAQVYRGAPLAVFLCTISSMVKHGRVPVAKWMCTCAYDCTSICDLPVAGATLPVHVLMHEAVFLPTPQVCMCLLMPADPIHSQHGPHPKRQGVPTGAAIAVP